MDLNHTIRNGGLVVGEREAELGKPEIHVASENLDETVEAILDDCFFAVGQAVGTRKVVEYSAVLWWRDHYRQKFLRAMEVFGDRWSVDRDRVTAVAVLFGERAVRYAGESESIDETAFRQAAADVERYCRVHSARRARHDGSRDDVERTLQVGYWCTH